MHLKGAQDSRIGSVEMFKGLGEKSGRGRLFINLFPSGTGNGAAAMELNIHLTRVGFHWTAS